jgi:hypothetical protein
MAESKAKSKAKPKSGIKSKTSSKPKTISKIQKAAKLKGKARAGTATSNEVIFKCSLCGEQKPISEMKIIKRFRPVIFVCQDCEKLVQ